MTGNRYSENRPRAAPAARYDANTPPLFEEVEASAQAQASAETSEDSPTRPASAEHSQTPLPADSACGSPGDNDEFTKPADVPIMVAWLRERWATIFPSPANGSE